MLKEAKTVRVDGNIYTVALLDSEFGAKQVSFRMPHFDQAAYERIIGTLHAAWVKTGNAGVILALPVADVENIKARMLALTEKPLPAPAPVKAAETSEKTVIDKEPEALDSEA